MMKHVKTLIAAAGFGLCAMTAQAATFDGYEETSPIYYSDLAVLDYFGGVGFISGNLVVDKLLTGFFSDLDTAPSGTIGVLDFSSPNGDFDGNLIDVSLTLTGGDDELAFLFERNLFGESEYAIGTFMGELGDDFLTLGAANVQGVFRLVGADLSAVPLPATLPMMLAGFGGLMVVRRRKQRA